MRKKVEVEKGFCDVCGLEADGSGVNVSIIVNGEAKLEFYSCRNIDLCKKHSKVMESYWAQIPENLLPDRYDPCYTDEQRAEMVGLLKEWEKLGFIDA